jgi:hypothetical protein
MNWSGRNVEKVPVIGQITTIPMMLTGGKSVINYPPETLQVVEIIDTKTGLVYVINKWYKPGVPQIVHSGIVESYTPYPTDNQQVSATH